MNLLVNGDAEKGSGGTAEPVGQVVGWVVRQGAPALVGYDVGGGYPTPADPGPGGGAGARFFSGGDSPVTALVQEVALPAAGSTGHRAVDAGRVRYVLSGWLGGTPGRRTGSGCPSSSGTGPGPRSRSPCSAPSPPANGAAPPGCWSAAPRPPCRRARGPPAYSSRSRAAAGVRPTTATPTRSHSASRPREGTRDPQQT